MKRRWMWAVAQPGYDTVGWPMSRKSHAELANKNMCDGKGTVVRILWLGDNHSRRMV